MKTNTLSSKPRRLGIEFGRIFAAIGIVWFHLEGGAYKSVGYGGLVYFLILFVVFQVHRSGEPSIRTRIFKRAKQLGSPWIAFLVVYGLINLVLGKPFLPYEGNLVERILAGSWIGLWFLPYCFLASAFVECLVSSKFGLRMVRSDLICILLTIVCFVFLVWGRNTNFSQPPWAQWLYSLPALPLGFLMANGVLSRKWNISVVAFLFASLATISWFDPNLGTSYGVGVSGIIFFSLVEKLPPLVGRLGKCGLGVYLVHPLWIGFVTRLSSTEFSPVLIWVVVSIGSFAFVYGIQEMLVSRLALLDKVRVCRK